MHGKTNVKKWKTFSRTTEQYIDHYEDVPVYGTRPIYGTRTVPVYTNVTGNVGIYSTGCSNGLNVPVTFYGVWATYASQNSGSGSRNYGTVTVAAHGTWTHDFYQYSHGGYSTCGWGYSYAMVGNKRYEYNQSIGSVGQVQTGTRTETYDTGQTEQYVDHVDHVPVYKEREVVKETWHPWWVRNKG